MTRVCLLFWLVFVRMPDSVGAQPIFQSEYNWTMEVGEGTYGLEQIAQADGRFPMTSIYFGSHSITAHRRLVEPGGLILLVMFAGTGWLSFRHFRKLFHEDR